MRSSKILTIAAGSLLLSANLRAGSYTLPGNPTGLSKTQDLIANAIHQATASRDEDPLKYIVRDMNGVVGDLDQYRTDHPVQIKEARCVAGLDDLIKKLEEQLKLGAGSGGSLNPAHPLPYSRIVGGPGGIRDLHDPRAGEKQWGSLPPKERQQILQSKTDGFPTGYESILESYYRRLAQEQTTPDQNPSETPTTNPAP